jgi:hypothetical protein
MPRYFFDLSDGLRQTRDHEGSQFESEEEARAEALKAGKQIVAERLAKGRSLLLAFVGKIEVTDEQGRVVCTVSLADAAHAGADST